MFIITKNFEKGFSLIGALIATVVLGILALLTTTLLVNQVGSNTSHQHNISRTYGDQYVSESIDCCFTLLPWIPDLISNPSSVTCDTINNDVANTLLHDSDSRKNSLHPKNSQGSIFVNESPALDPAGFLDKGYYIEKWNIALRCETVSASNDNKYLTLYTWRLTTDPRTAQDQSLARDHNQKNFRLCAKEFADPVLCQRLTPIPTPTL